MNNVEKKLVQDFRDWRTQNKKTETTKEAIQKDMEEFMEERFQITQTETDGEQPINILDILDMMISPDVDASINVNSIGENEIACKQLASNTDDNSGCTRSCSDARFTLGDKCLYVSNHLSTASQKDSIFKLSTLIFCVYQLYSGSNRCE